jgi:hypothetical protein
VSSSGSPIFSSLPTDGRNQKSGWEEFIKDLILALILGKDWWHTGLMTLTLKQY